MAEQTLNIPQIIAVVLVGFLAIRWFLSPSSTQSSGRNAGRQINQAHVDQVSAMFPQLDRRTIMWDLQRNGGSVQATTERVLGGRTLDTPPPSFQPQAPRSATPLAATPANSSASKPALPDLITRYNLSSKVTTTASEEEGSASSSAAEAKKAQAWSANKSERSDQLRKRREEMILAARRKLEEKDRVQKAQS